jgi:hypothetical protein
VIPHRDIIASWINTGTFVGPSPGTLAYVAGTPPSWIGLQWGTIFADGGYYILNFGCIGGKITLTLESWVGNGTTEMASQCVMPLNDGDDFTCDPFHLHFVLAGHSTADCTVLSGSFGDPHLNFTDIWFD